MHPDFKWSKEGRLWDVKFLNAIQNLDAQSLEIRTNGYHFFQNHLKFGLNVWILNSSVFKWPGYSFGPDPCKIRPFLKCLLEGSDFRSQLFCAGVS